MVGNPLLAPLNPKCRICTRELVAEPNDVTMRLFDAEAKPRPPKDAAAYLAAVGVTATARQRTAIALVHRRHIAKWLETNGTAVAPAQVESGVQRIPSLEGDVSWLDVQRQGMKLGEEANRLIAARLVGMEDRELISVAKLGQTAATTRATLEIKGAIKRQESIARLASGFEQPEDDGE